MSNQSAIDRFGDEEHMDNFDDVREDAHSDHANNDLHESHHNDSNSDEAPAKKKTNMAIMVVPLAFLAVAGYLGYSKLTGQGTEPAPAAGFVGTPKQAPMTPETPAPAQQPPVPAQGTVQPPIGGVAQPVVQGDAPPAPNGPNAPAALPVQPQAGIQQVPSSGATAPQPNVQSLPQSAPPQVAVGNVPTVNPLGAPQLRQGPQPQPQPMQPTLVGAPVPSQAPAGMSIASRDGVAEPEHSPQTVEEYTMIIRQMKKRAASIQKMIETLEAEKKALKHKGGDKADIAKQHDKSEDEPKRHDKSQKSKDSDSPREKEQKKPSNKIGVESKESSASAVDSTKVRHDFTASAVVDDRAWLEGAGGSSFTVAVNDKLPDGSVVKSITMANSKILIKTSAGVITQDDRPRSSSAK